MTSHPLLALLGPAAAVVLVLGQLTHLHVSAAPPAQRGALGAVVSL